jgi:hypothetical protein
MGAGNGILIGDVGTGCGWLNDWANCEIGACLIILFI